MQPLELSNGFSPLPGPPPAGGSVRPFVLSGGPEGGQALPGHPIPVLVSDVDSNFLPLPAGRGLVGAQPRHP